MRTYNIAPVLPYLVQFVLSSVTLENDCARQLKLLYVLQALLANRCLFMGHTPVVSTSRSIVHMHTHSRALKYAALKAFYRYMYVGMQ